MLANEGENALTMRSLASDSSLYVCTVYLCMSAVRVFQRTEIVSLDLCAAVMDGILMWMESGR